MLLKGSNTFLSFQHDQIDIDDLLEIVEQKPVVLEIIKNR